MEKENIIEKVKKLLSLADNNKNASEAEVSAALLKAQELMAKYDLSIADTTETKEQCKVVECEHKWDMGFRIPLATIIAKNFRCELMLTGKKIVFFGFSTDAQIAKSVFESAYTFVLREGNKHYNKAYAMGLKTKGVFNSYAAGFLAGMEQALDEQCVALMIVTPVEVTDAFHDFTKNMRTRTTRLQLDEINRDVFHSGKEDGKNMMAKKKRINA